MGRQTTMTAKAKVTAAKKRVRTAKRTPATKDVYKIRRILAQRTVKRGNHEEREFLVDWYPQWQHAEHVEYDKEAIKEWETNSKNGHTFNFKNDQVYRCSNPTEDDGKYQVRLLTNGVIRQFKNWMMRDPNVVAADLFKTNDDGDWAYYDIDQRNIASAAARVIGLKRTPTAMQALSRTYISMRKSEETIYGDILIKYLGQVDDSLPRAEATERTKHMTISQFLEPLFRVNFAALKPATWKTGEAKHKHLEPLSIVASRFATIAPYMLKHPKPMMFVRLFWPSETVAWMLLNNLQIDCTEGWEDRTRDFFLHTYIAAFPHEERAVDHVERSYLRAKEQVMWHAKYKNKRADPEQAEYADDREESEQSDGDKEDVVDDNDESVGLADL